MIESIRGRSLLSLDELSKGAIVEVQCTAEGEAVPRSDIDPRYIIRPYYLRPSD